MVPHHQWQQMRLQAIAPIDVGEYEIHLPRLKGSKPATVDRRLAFISAFCWWATRHDLTKIDAADGTGDLQGLHMAPRWLGKKEHSALSRAAQKEGKHPG
jgi:hypothetical protein